MSGLFFPINSVAKRTEHYKKSQKHRHIYCLSSKMIKPAHTTAYKLYYVKLTIFLLILATSIPPIFPDASPVTPFIITQVLFDDDELRNP